MHNGPALAYLAPFVPNTPPQQLKFFKIYEKGFDPSLDKWANQIASDNYDSFKVQLPSDIKSGTYVFRTELIALHGNMKELKSNTLREQIQIYPHCFNIEITGSGTATPEGVVFPGGYTPTEPGIKFQPFMTYGTNITGATEYNTKYTPPGPPRYAGKYDLPKGPLPVVKETGIFPPDIEVKYQDLIKKIERPSLKLATYINAAWPGYTAEEDTMKKYGKMAAEGIAEARQVRASVDADINSLKAAIQALPKPA